MEDKQQAVPIFCFPPARQLSASSGLYHEDKSNQSSVFQETGGDGLWESQATQLSKTPK